MIIPEKFDIGPFTIPVLFQENLWEDSQKVGTAHLGKQKIILQPPMPDYNVKCCKQAFLHELMYMVLFYAGQRELYTDKVLVDTVANLLYQVMETMEGNALKNRREKCIM